jgi:NADPH:quinone reductase-like Zn-dependent oxidoreductase
MTMQAWKHYSMATVLQLEAVPKPTPKAGEVLLKVEAAGLCHSDVCHCCRYLRLFRPEPAAYPQRQLGEFRGDR